MYGISPDQAQRDVESTLCYFHTECLLGAGPSGEIEKDIEESTTYSQPNTDSRPVIEQYLGAVHYYFSLPGHLIDFSSTEQRAATEYVHALEFFSVSLGERTPDTTLSVVPSSNTDGTLRHDVYINGRCCARDLLEKEIVPVLVGVTFSRIAESLTDKLLFHAAVVEKNHRAILFPGQAGSGKTTLAATLARMGYQFFADELALLDPQSGLIAPLPLPMSIKPGAVSVLSIWYPEIMQLPVYTRADGKEVAILPPVLDRSLDLNERVEPAAIIFPRYDWSAFGQIVEIGKTAAITRLVSLCSSSRQLVEQDIAAMVRLVDSVPCYEAMYSKVQTVYDFLEERIC